MKKPFWMVLGCVMLCALRSQGQTIVGNQQVITLPSSPWATTQALLSLPSDYNSSTTQRYPLIIFLHGVGQAGTNISNLLTDQGGIPYRISQGFVPEAVSPVDGKMTKFIVVSPQSPSWSYQYNQVYFILPGILAKYRVDTTRIYITGLSAGGNGALTCITDDPNFCGKIAAVSVMSAASITSTEAAAMKNVDINHLPFWDICGTADPNDFYLPNVSYVNTVESNSPNPTPDSTWLYGVGHSSWFQGYDPNWTGRSGHSKGLNMYQWFLLWQRGNTIPWGPAVKAPTTPHVPPVALPLPLLSTITLPVSSVTLSGSTSTDIDGTITQYAWTYVSGPSTYTLTNATTATPTASNLVTGTYVFKLTVTDNTGSASSANVSIIVNPLAQILAPVAKVVSNSIQVNLPVDTTVLNGSPSTPPAGATLTSYQWTVASGPSGAVLKNATKPMAVLGGLTKGSYKAALVVKDNLGGTASDTVTVSVAGTTAPPVAKVTNNNVKVTLPQDYAVLNGSPSTASAGATLTSYQWTLFSGPAGSKMENGTTSTAVLAGLVAGTYKAILVVKDNLGNADADTVTVLAAAAPAAPTPPVAKVTSNHIKVSLPQDYAVLNGSPSTAPTGATLTSYQWTFLSGPAGSKMQNGATATAVLTGLVAGSYKAVLVVKDNQGASDADTVNILVSAVIPPIAKVTNNHIAVTLPQDYAVLNGTPSITPSGTTITAYRWSLLSGATGTIMQNGTKAAAVLAGLKAGSYKVLLTVTDNLGASDVDTVNITVASAVKTDLVTELVAAPPAPTAKVTNNNISVTLPQDYAVLNGTPSTAPSGATVTGYRWSLLSGAAGTNLENGTQAVAVLAGLKAGAYKALLTVTDSKGASDADTVNITVASAVQSKSGTVQAPSAKVTNNNIKVTLPQDYAVLNGTPSTAPSGASLTSYQWTYLSGPAGSRMENGTSASAVLTGLVAGAYKARLVVTDNQGATDADTVNITVASTQGVGSTCKGKRVNLVQAGDHGIELAGTSIPYSPGDTLVIPNTGTPYTWIDLSDIYGTATCPVTIINGGGQVLANTRLNCTNCRFVHITGTGSSGTQYGFLLQNATQTSVGVNISGRSANVELDHISFYHMDYGIWVKQDQGCIDSLNYPNWTIDHISIHDNRIVGTYDEGMYLGTTDPNGTRVISCNGTTPNPLPKPLRLSNFSIYNNYIDSTGRSGIQLSCAQTGDNEIYNNHISNSGMQLNPEQGNGISLGGYTQAHIHDNVISNTFTMGIFALGAGVEQIDHNTILLSGHLGGGSPLTGSITVDTRPTSPADSSKFVITNNILGTNTDVNVRIYNAYATYAYANVICSNVTPSGAAASYVVPSGIHYTTGCAATVARKGTPVAKAGGTYTLTLPTNSITLNGSTSSDATAPITTYEWAYVSGPGDPVLSAGNTAKPVLSNLQTGTFKYLLTISDTSQAAASDTATVVVLPSSTAGTGPVAAASGTDTVYLPTDWTALDGTGSYARGTGAKIVSYQWSVLGAPTGSGFILTNAAAPLATLTHMDATGAYTVQLKVTDNAGLTATNSYLIRVLNYSQVPTAVIVAPATLTLPASLSLNGSTSFPTPYSPLASYQWSQVSGPNAATLATPTGKTTTAGNLTAGTYVFQLTVANMQGIPGSTTASVLVKAAGSDASADTLLPMDSIAAHASGPFTKWSVKLYPNPVQSGVNVWLAPEISGNLSFSVFDASGRLHFINTRQKEAGNSSIETFNVSMLARGIYFLKVNNAKGERITLTFIKVD